MTDTRTTAVVCGDLNMLRCFVGSRVPTIAVCNTPDDVTLASRHARNGRVITGPRSDPRACVEDLLEIGRECALRPVLYYADDGMLLAISRDRDRLAEHFRFLLPEARLVEDLADKTRFVELAGRYGLSTPRTVSSREAAGAAEIVQRLSLPVVLKPNSHINWFTSSIVLATGGEPRKALVADTVAELQRFYDALRTCCDDFVIQEYVPGGDNCIYSFHAYYDAHSRPLAWYVGRKLRTFPKGAGVSTYLALAREPRVARLSMETLERLAFVGPVKIDLKMNERTGELSVLEINPRFTLWNHLGAACGVNLPLTAQADLMGEPVPVWRGYRTSVRWLSFEQDFKSFLRHYRRHGDLSWRSWLASFVRPKVYDVLSWDDLRPLMMYAVAFVSLRVRKLSASCRRVLRRAGRRPVEPIRDIGTSALVRGVMK